MSLFSARKLQTLTSAIDRVCEYFATPEQRAKMARKARHLVFDPLEERQLLSSTSTLVADTGLVISTGADGMSQATTSGQSVATDDNGDAVVTWTATNATYDADQDKYVYDTNVYAEYLTHNVQQLALAAGTKSFYLIYGGTTITQTLSFSSNDAVGGASTPNITGTVGLSFTSGGTTYSFTISYNETSYSNFAANLQNALQTQIGGQFANASVVATDARTFAITFNAATGGDGNIYQTDSNGKTTLVSQSFLTVDNTQTIFTSNASGSYAAVQISKTTVPIVLGKIYVSSSSPTATAASILSYMEGKTADVDVTAPTDETGSQTGDNLVLTATGLDVTVTSVATASDPYGLYHFQITFNGDMGYKILDKLVIANARDASGTDVTPLLNSGVTILKQSSGIFRVNNEEIDNPYTYGLDVTNQYDACVAMDGDGDFIITWVGENIDGTSDIYARRFTTQQYVTGSAAYTDTYSYRAYLPSGDLQTYYIQSVRPEAAPQVTHMSVLDDGSTFIVNTLTAQDVSEASVAMNDSGNFVISWTSKGQSSSYFNEIYARMFTADGKPTDIEHVLSTTANGVAANEHHNSYVAISNSNLVVVVWEYVTTDLHHDGQSGVLLKWDWTATTLSGLGSGMSDGTVAFDANDDFVVTWTAYNNLGDTMANAVNTYGSVYAAEFNSSGANIMAARVINSYGTDGDGAPPAAYPLLQGGGQVVLDADGDITVVYSGYGQDVTSDNHTLDYYDAAYYICGSVGYDTFTYNNKTYDSYLKRYDPTLLADMVTYLGLSSNSAARELLRSWIYAGGSYTLTDVDTVVNMTLVTASNYFDTAGLTSSTIREALLGRIGVLLNGVIGLLRGEANGVMYSQIDANPIAGGYSNITVNATVNTYRDGSNNTYNLILDDDMTGGGYVIRLASPANGAYVDLVLTPVLYPGGGINVGATIAAWDDAIEACTAQLGGAFANDAITDGQVSVRQVTNTELNARATTAYAVYDGSGHIVTSSTNYIVLEFIFQGSVHDLHVSFTTVENQLTKTQNEVQTITVLPGTGSLAISVGTATSADFSITVNSDYATNLVALQRIMSMIASVATVQTARQTGTYTWSNYTPLNGGGFTFTLTFGGTYSGQDQGDVLSIDAAAQTAGSPGTYYSLTGGSITSVEALKGGASVTAYGALVTVNNGNSGTVQDQASVAGQSNGTFIVAYTQTNQYSDGTSQATSLPMFPTVYDNGTYVANSGQRISTDDYSESILIRTFQDTTDTAGPTITAVESADGKQVLSAGTIATNSGVTYLVLDVNEALYCVPDVETQLEQLGVTADSTLVGKVSLISGLTLTLASDAQIITATKAWAKSVLNTQSYIFSVNGTVVSGAVVAVNYGLNEAAVLGIGGQTLGRNKYQIVLTLDSDLSTAGLQAFKAGNYSLRIKHYIETSTTITGQTGLCDAKGNPLNLTGFNTQGANTGGADFTFAFTVTGSSSGGGSSADTPTDPSSTKIDTAISTAGKEDSANVASDSAGNYIVVWVRYDASGNGDIIGQMFDSAGNKMEGEFVVNDDSNGTFVAGNQINPSVSMNDAGKIVVTWSGDGPNGYGVYARCYTYGSVAGINSQTDVFYVNTPTTLNQQQCAQVALANSGAWVVTWTVKDSTNGQSHVFAKMYDKNNNALGTQFQVDNGVCNNNGGNNSNTSANLTYDVKGLDISISATGAFVIVWQGSSNSTSWDIYGQLFSANGDRYGNVFRVNTVTAAEQIMPSVSMDDAGDFVVTWSSYGQDGSYWGIYARRYNATGGAINTKEFQVNQTSLYTQYESDVACDATGNFTITWATYGQDVQDNTLPQGYGVYARMYLGDGTDYLDTKTGKAVGEFRINSNTPGSVPSAPTGDQLHPAIIRNATNSDAVIVWVGPDSDGTTSIFARRLDPPQESAAVQQGPAIYSIVAATAAGAPTLVWAVSDSTGISSVTLSINGTAFIPTANGSATSAKYSVSLSSLAAGTYTYIITATNANGVVSQAVGQFTLAASTITTPLTIANVKFSNSTGSNILSWDVTDNVSITSAILTLDGKEILIDSDTGTPLGRSYAALLGDLSVGVHTYTITAVDVDNNWVVYTNTLTVSSTIPAISNIATTASLITWTVSDTDGLGSSFITINGGSPIVGTVISTGANTATYSASISDLPTGAYSYTITAIDALGTHGTATGSFDRANTSGPAISDIVATSDTLTWTATDVDGIASSTLKIGDKTISVTKVSTSGNSTVFTASLYSLADGAYSYLITATDANTTDPQANTASGTLTIARSTISSVTATATTASQKSGLNWTVADASGINAVTLTIGGTTASVAKKSGTKYSAAYAYSASLAAGTYDYTIAVKNAAGGTTTYNGRLTVADTPTAISKVAVKASTSNKATSISWKATDADGIASATLTLNGNAVTVKKSGNGTTASYSYSGNLAAGSYDYTITMTDSKGNVTTYTGKFTVKATAPVISSVKLTAKSAATPAAISWKAVDYDGIASVTLTIDGTAVTVIDNGSGLYSYSGYVAAGSHKCVITVTDAAGLSTSVTKSFKVANTRSVINNVMVTPGTSATGSSLSWQATDVDGIKSVALTIDGAAATVTTVSSTGTSGTYSFTGVLTAGVHKYVIFVTDSTGTIAKLTGSFKVTAASNIVAGALASVGGTAKTDWLIDSIG